MSEQRGVNVRRRFIAGANCPECGATDRIQRCEVPDRIWMECVACGMKRELDAEKQEGRKVVKLPVINRGQGTSE